jgi:hypothetical protein
MLNLSLGYLFVYYELCIRYGGILWMDILIVGIVKLVDILDIIFFY